MRYKNLSHSTKTFYGVTFRPGEIKEVSGYINDVNFIRVPNLPKEPPRRRKLTSVEHSKPTLKNLAAQPDEPESRNDKQGGKPNGSDSNQ